MSKEQLIQYLKRKIKETELWIERTAEEERHKTEHNKLVGEKIAYETTLKYIKSKRFA